jgi:DNA-binding MarR family transcriptional regulator
MVLEVDDKVVDMTALVNRKREVPLPAKGPGYWLRAGDRAVSRRLTVELQARGIPFSIFVYLRVLLEKDGMTQGELSELAGTDRATTTGMLDTMEQMGIVRRKPHDSDRRKINVILTPKGRRLRSDFSEAINAANAVILDGISPGEYEQFRKTVATMIANVDRHRLEVG